MNFTTLTIQKAYYAALSVTKKAYQRTLFSLISEPNQTVK